jgi:hypothetical protein
LSVDEDAAPGTVIGMLAVCRGGAGPWAFSLVDDAGGRFALSGASLVTGATPLSHAAMPRPEIVVVATGGGRAFRAGITVAVEPAPGALRDENDAPLADEADFAITGA